MSEMVRRWAPRIAVLVGLVGLLVVGWQYAQYVTVFGDDPCRSRGFCDERAIAVARRGLSRWYLASASFAVLGLVVVLTRRSWRRRPVPDQVGGFSGVRHTGLAFLVTFAWLGWLVASSVFWLFGGAPLLVAVVACWLVGLTWGLDRVHRRADPGEATGATLLVSGAAALAATLAALLGFALVYVLEGKGSLVLPPLFVLASVVLVTAVARMPVGGGPAAAVAGVVVTVLVGAVLVGVTDEGRDSVRSLRDEFHPEVPSAVSSAVLPPPEPGPRPPGRPDPLPTPRPTPAPVQAARPCGSTDLTLEATGWDSAMGDSSVTIVATNGSATACWVEGYPKLRLLQGGADLRLVVGHPARSDQGLPLTPQRVGVAPGGGAVFGWWWKGYRNAADQSTPQTVVLALGRGAPARLELPGDPYLVDVIEHAEVDVTPWGPRVD
ncbi:DUF4232 domain-containing protein [Pedococcus bigeumensis]|uniref:DUF4232 domain-containing protein n=1 Tax=Pedococcus bigeumensis TaxID=433644 RepID=UPI002FEC1063